MADRAGYSVRRREFLTLPLEIVDRGGPEDVAGAGDRVRGAIKRIDRIGTALRPTLFAYQFLYELEPAPWRSRTRSHRGVRTGSSRMVPEKGAWPAALPIVA